MPGSRAAYRSLVSARASSPPRDGGLQVRRLSLGGRKRRMREEATPCGPHARTALWDRVVLLTKAAIRYTSMHGDHIDSSLWPHPQQDLFGVRPERSELPCGQ